MRVLVSQGHRIVYGGAKNGLMGVMADEAIRLGGTVVGVIPALLVDKELIHKGLNEIHVVASMHERKKKMSDLADAFLALPGGAGTFEEILEQWTWTQLGIHAKPCGVLDFNGYFAPLSTGWSTGESSTSVTRDRSFSARPSRTCCQVCRIFICH